MDFVHPVRAVIPGAQGRVLEALARSESELNLRTIADLAGVSPAHASRVLPRLVELGLVERREAPPSSLFKLAEGNLAVRVLLDLVHLRNAFISELRSMTTSIRPAPVNVTVYGSFARGDATAESDLDILIVRPVRISEDDPAWTHSLERWRTGVERLGGNPVRLLIVGRQELSDLLHSGRGLWEDIVSEGTHLGGHPLSQLETGRSA